jgi:hypothetical protein
MATTYIDVTEGSGKKVAAHSFTEDAVTKYAERAAPGTGVLTIPDTANIAAETDADLYPASVINIQGQARIVIKTSFSVASASQVWRLLLYDSAGDLIGCLPSTTEVYTAVASAAELDEDTRYIGTMFVFSNDSGAASLKIRMTAAPSSGNVSFFVAGV